MSDDTTPPGSVGFPIGDDSADPADSRAYPRAREDRVPPVERRDVRDDEMAAATRRTGFWRYVTRNFHWRRDIVVAGLLVAAACDANQRLHLHSEQERNSGFDQEETQTPDPIWGTPGSLGSEPGTEIHLSRQERLHAAVEELLDARTDNTASWVNASATVGHDAADLSPAMTGVQRNAAAVQSATLSI